jgi:hypothetical protein
MNAAPTICPTCGTRWYDPAKQPGARCNDRGSCVGKLVKDGE